MLANCLASLETQTFRDFEACVVDNSGKQVAREVAGRLRGVSLIENSYNAGFGAAVNQAFRSSKSRFCATLNDDAVADRNWLACLVRALEAKPEAGMCASQVRLAGGIRLDSAGMLISGDASGKQRGNLQPVEQFRTATEVLFPSGSAALYRRAMLDQIGLFDEAFFLYCEDTDLGLRGRWAGWTCLYVPEAIVEHHYSQTAGSVSPLKAYYVERNRLFVLLKNFPTGLLLRAPGFTAARYFWHLLSVVRGSGSAARFRAEHAGVFEMAYIAARAHAAQLKHVRRLLHQRRLIRRDARITVPQFEQLIADHFISPREVAEL